MSYSFKVLLIAHLRPLACSPGSWRTVLLPRLPATGRKPWCRIWKSKWPDSWKRTRNSPRKMQNSVVITQPSRKKTIAWRNTSAQSLPVHPLPLPPHQLASQLQCPAKWRSRTAPLHCHARQSLFHPGLQRLLFLCRRNRFRFCLVWWCSTQPVLWLWGKQCTFFFTCLC